jgi:hypothetical protein
MKRPEQVERIRRAERERDQRHKDPQASARARAVLDAVLRNSSPEEKKEANPF